MRAPKPLYSKVTIFGHPVYPMLVGFPVAFYCATLVGFVIFGVNREPFWYRLAYVANAAGVTMAVVAALPGFIDWALGVPSRTRAKIDGAIHMGLNILALLMFSTNLMVSGTRSGGDLPGAGPAITLSSMGLFFTLCAGWFGWRMVQTHHVGITPTAPVQPSRGYDDESAVQERRRAGLK